MAESLIQLDSGPIFRNADGIYRGNPYTAPPVEQLRWMPPQPVNPWPGPRLRDSFGLVCEVAEHAERIKGFDNTMKSYFTPLFAFAAVNDFGVFSVP